MDWKRIAASVLMLGVLAVPASAASITPQTTMKEIRDDPDIKASGLYTYTYVWERDCERLSTSRDDETLAEVVGKTSAEACAAGLNYLAQVYHDGTRVTYPLYSEEEIAADQRNQTWLELEYKYRPWIDFDALPFYGRGAGWQRQLHIYECPFYYIDYCLSTMAALQFFLLSLHDQKDAWARYLRLVRRAGTASYTELCETAGLQVPFNDGSIKAIAQQMSQWIAEHQV